MKSVQIQTKATGASTEEVLANDANVELGNFEVTKSSYGVTNTKLTIKVTNKTSEKKSFSFHIEAVDATGERTTYMQTIQQQDRVKTLKYLHQ